MKRHCTNCIATNCRNGQAANPKKTVEDEKIKTMSATIAQLEYALGQEKIKNKSLLEELGKLKERRTEEEMEARVEKKRADQSKLMGAKPPTANCAWYRRQRGNNRTEPTILSAGAEDDRGNVLPDYESKYNSHNGDSRNLIVYPNYNSSKITNINDKKDRSSSNNNYTVSCLL